MCQLDIRCIFIDGTCYVADVPELPGCAGRGESYLDAVANAETAISEWIFNAINSGKTPPEPAQDFILRPKLNHSTSSHVNPVMLRLRRKYGNLSNRDLAIKLGLTGDYETSVSTFTNSTTGKGSRFVRCAIALALEESPSLIWPALPAIARQRDDELYFATIADNERL